jgi:FG-GAP-like repeat
MRLKFLLTIVCALLAVGVQGGVLAPTLALTVAPQACGVPDAGNVVPLPAAAHQRLAHSQAVSGVRDIAWVWLGSPTLRYPHAALGSAQHAGSLHVIPNKPQAQLQTYSLPVHRVFEDRVPRLVDLDGDGRDEILLVEADVLYGAALVVLGLRKDAIVELARGPSVGSSFRWLNPVGVADFDGDGRSDLASVTTPHIGGVLTLFHYRPPRLEPFARFADVSNHHMGEPEQQLAVIVTQTGLRPIILIPDMPLTALHALRWEPPGQWAELVRPLALPARVKRFTPLDGGGCLQLTDGSWWRARLRP